jgi:hypothetical protein
MNTEYPPLLPAGFQDLKIEDLENRFVEPFANPQPRKQLIENLKLLLDSELKPFGIKFEVWLDGSFTTKKPNPNDIDIVFFVDEQDVMTLPRNRQVDLTNLFLHDKGRIKITYKCDIYVVAIPNPTNRSYWRGWFGFNRNEEPKGIARIFI